MTYRQRLQKATRAAKKAANREGKPITWQLARINGQMWLTLMGVGPSIEAIRRQYPGERAE